MVYRLILPKWITEDPSWSPRALPRSLELELSEEDLALLNAKGYNCFWFPNYASQPEIAWDEDRNISGVDIDRFQYVFVDMDLKDKDYKSKEEFYEAVGEFELKPTMIVDSGNGVHVYWQTTDLNAMDLLRIQRRLARALNTDLAVGKLNQLMRVWNTDNTKQQDNYKPCELLYEDVEAVYSAEDLDRVLPKISIEDEVVCQNHYDTTYSIAKEIEFDEELPAAWFTKFPKGTEGYQLFYGKVKDRSAADYRLAHLMLAEGFNEPQAMSVLTKTNKATTRAGAHRISYAKNIVQKVWTYVEAPKESKPSISRSIRDILEGTDMAALAGERFPCNEIVDATEHGFRLSQVLGLIAGAGAGKTTWALNLFKWFCEKNPEYIHVFVTLEQPEGEIAARWQKISQDNPAFYDNIYVIGNYNDDGTYRYLSIHDVEDHVKSLEESTGRKVGCVVIDHIGVLKKESRNGEYEGLMDICQYMKAFAKNTNTFLIMQSQTSREKAGIGDIELDKDAAFGTSMFEWFCDYITTVWQPLKRIYEKAPHMTVTCFKFCKIRHKNTVKDKIKEDVSYALMFDPEYEQLRLLTEDEIAGYEYFNKQATALRGKDKKHEPAPVNGISWVAKKREKAKSDDREPDNN